MRFSAGGAGSPCDRRQCKGQRNNGVRYRSAFDAIAKALPVSRKKVTLLVPFSRGEILHEIRQNGEVLSQAYTDGGIKIEAFADAAYLNKIKEYIL